MTQEARAFPPAQISSRAGAYVIDAFLCGAAFTLFYTLVVLAGLLRGDPPLVGSLVRAITFAVVSLLYFGYTWTRMRGSPGQLLLHLLTVNAKDRAPLSWRQSVTRWAYLLGPVALATLLGDLTRTSGIAAALVIGALLAYEIYLFRTASRDPSGQGWHDKQAGTLVLNRAAH